jgi:tRNA A-37 threonylcarbamoyl transferase component Bud32
MTERLAAALADRYRIERELGQGGMATVYLAEDLKHHRKVALKVLKPELAAVLGAERFLAEIETTANLQHPHILPLFDSGEADSFLYYVMPFVEGESLRDRLEREHQLPVDDALAIAQKVASALQYAHEQGVVHRDIKPANILLARGEPLVADFGIALAVSQAGGGRITETGLSLGTPHYMSPEQASGERSLDPRSDVYALACVLYEMLTGQPPFGGSSAQAVLARILTGDPERPTAHRRSVPPQVEAAVLRGLERLPADRFRSAADFAAALRASAAGATLGVTPAGRGGDVGAGVAEGARAAPARARSIRRFLPWALTGLAVVVAAASWIVRGGGPVGGTMTVALEPPQGSVFAEFAFAALSPDGTRLAFVGLRPSGGRVLWIRDLATGEADSLHATSGAQSPFWSADGRSLGYMARGSLWRIEADGTGSRGLCDTPDGGGSWSTKGVILFTRNGHPMTVSADGGTCAPVGGIWSDTTRTIRGTEWLPDGTHFAGVSGGAVVVSGVGGEVPVPLIPDARDVRFVAPDIVVFAKPSTVGSDVAAQRFDPGKLALVGTPTTLARDVRAAGAITSFAVSAGALAYLHAWRTDRGPLVVDSRGGVVDSIVQSGTWTLRRARSHPTLALGGQGLWQYDLARGTALALRSSEYAVFPVWSPGDSLLAVGGVSPDCGVKVMRLGAGSDTMIVATRATAVTASDCLTVPTDWTSDGRFVVLNFHPAASPDHGEIWTYEVATGELEKLLSVTGTASAGVVSPDLRWLAYVSDETGELQVYLRPFRRAGAPVRVSADGGGTPRWEADGRHLFYITPDGRIMRVAVPAGPGLHPGTPELLFRAPRWSMRLFADQAGGQQLTTPYDVSPDGQTFYVRQRTEETAAATLVLNWQALLEGRASAR